MTRQATFVLALLLSAALPATADTDSAATADPGIPAAELPKVKLTVTPAEVSVGELATWKVDIDRRSDQRVHLPSSASFGELQIHSKDVGTDAPSGGRVHESLTVRLIGFEAGERAIPPQKLTVVDEQGRLGEVEIEPSIVKVKSLIANEPTPALKEDTGPGVDVYQEDYTLLYVGIALLAALAIVGLTLLGRWLWSKRRPRPAPPPPPPRPAEVIAREKLAALQAGDLLERGEIKEFHILLSEALREYLGNRYGFDSLEMSTEEIAAVVRGVGLGVDDFQELRGLLEDTDLVKFAKYLPPHETSKELLGRTSAFVERTTPRANPGGGHAA